MSKIAYVTCRTWPDLNPSDRLYADAMEQRGHQTVVLPWNDPQMSHMLDEVDAVVFRSNYDYHDEWTAFETWLRDLEAKPLQILNPPALLHWNLRKSYLFELASWGIRVPHSFLVPDGLSGLTTVFDETGWDRAVAKPHYGGNGRGVTLIDRKKLRTVWSDLSGIASQRDLIVQEFLPEIAAGEVSMVYFDDNFSHAVRKVPAPGEFRANSAFKPTRTLFQPRQSDIETGRMLISKLPELPLYSRIDGIQRPGEFVVLEVELHEPHLFIDYLPDSAQMFASATQRRL